MDTYYDEEGTVLGHAWGGVAMVCNNDAQHRPHAHRPAHTIYGPYMCPGIPQVPIYSTPPQERKPIPIV